VLDHRALRDGNAFRDTRLVLHAQRRQDGSTSGENGLAIPANDSR